MDFKKAIDTIRKKGITAYEIHKAKGLNEAGLRRIILGEVENPQRKTKQAIIEYVSSTVDGKKQINSNSELSEKDIEVVVNAILLHEEKLLEVKIFKQWLDNKLLARENEVLKEIKEKRK